jgi:hypothetical protein
MNLLDRFVSTRFWLAPAFILIYYIQLLLPASPCGLRRVFLAVLILVLLAAILANLRWIPDYASRLIGGIDSLRKQPEGIEDEGEILEQIRWANAKILAIISIILASLVQYEKLYIVPTAHRVPVMIVALLVFVALFDAALDLEAEWTISILAASRSQGVGKVLLSHAIWNTNQFRPSQKQLFERLEKKEMPTVSFRAFTATAQNLISFAIIVTAGMAALAIRLLYLQW